MNPDTHVKLGQEWATLQNNHERYEHSALIIRIAAIALFAAGVAWPHGEALRPAVFFGILCFVLAMLWAQEAILRTSQARLGERLLQIEAMLRTAGDDDLSSTVAMQLHSDWQTRRPGSFGLMREYAANAIRPTIAFPYIVLVALLLLLALCH